jgi:hypothetical protein
LRFKIGSRDFLFRARNRLDEKLPESLIYAAIELRMGVEARLQQYNDALEEFSRNKKTGWKLKIIDKHIESMFHTGKKITEILFINPVDGRLKGALYHTPISKILVKNAEKIGDLLHGHNLFKTQKEEWYSETKIFLESTYLELHKANRGTLLAPLLWNPKTGESKMFIEAYEGYDPTKIAEMWGTEGSLTTFNISYSDSYPEINIPYASGFINANNTNK